jgi:hypothetical protein
VERAGVAECGVGGGEGCDGVGAAGGVARGEVD